MSGQQSHIRMFGRFAALGDQCQRQAAAALSIIVASVAAVQSMFTAQCNAWQSLVALLLVILVQLGMAAHAPLPSEHPQQPQQLDSMLPFEPGLPTGARGTAAIHSMHPMQAGWRFWLPSGPPQALNPLAASGPAPTRPLESDPEPAHRLDAAACRSWCTIYPGPPLGSS